MVNIGKYLISPLALTRPFCDDWLLYHCLPLAHIGKDSFNEMGHTAGFSLMGGGVGRSLSMLTLSPFMNALSLHKNAPEFVLGQWQVLLRISKIH